jgi:biotin operon repressor
MTITKQDKRTIALIPLRALTDANLTDGAFRILGLICSYCDKEGITWVSQKRLSEDMKISRPAITKQITKLRTLGYIETVKKGHRNTHSNTIKVLFEARAQPIVDELDEEVDVQARQVMMQMIAKAFNKKAIHR